MADDPGYAVTDTIPIGDVPYKTSKAQQTQTDQLIDAMLAGGTTFCHDPDGEGFATVPIGDRIECHRIQSKPFGKLVRQFYWRANADDGKQGKRPKGVSESALKDALASFEAMALDGEERTPEVRLMHHKRAVWLDPGRADGSLIRVTTKDWRLVKRADVPLIRTPGMRELPIPKHDPKALANLRFLLNVGGDSDFMLIVAWLLATLYPNGPYPVLALGGEMGSGKSVLSKMLRRLVDPNKAELRPLSTKQEELLLAAANGRVVALDNVSSITPDMADALCRLATGAGFSRRRLYSDTDEVIVSVCRPVLLNGIPSLLTRGDLADRAIAITLPPVPDKERRPESEIWKDFDAAAPGILALLLDGLVMALKRLPEADLPRLPRMADFARLAWAAAPAFGWTGKDMLAALERNRVEAVEATLDTDPVAIALQRIAAVYTSGWTGTAKDLFDVVRCMEDGEFGNELPKSLARLSNSLKRLTPLLRHIRIDVKRDREAGTGRRIITIARRPTNTIKIKIKGQASQASHASQVSQT